MKTSRRVALAAVVYTANAIHVQPVAGFGPASCVSVSRSSSGTCVVHTNCVGQDLGSYDLSFDCVRSSGRKTHSMGVGSFDVNEEYDTELKCDECLPPAGGKPEVQHNRSAAGVSLAVVSATHEVAKLRGSGVLRKKSESRDDPLNAEIIPKAELYGPNECVGVWRDPSHGQCIMKTDCDKNVELAVYEFGLVCVDEFGSMTRHIFGMGSFGHQEVFNTLIKCHECLSLDEYMNGDEAVSYLTKMVKDMKNDLQMVSSDVDKLNKEVFDRRALVQAPPEPKESKEPVNLAAQSTQVVRQQGGQQKSGDQWEVAQVAPEGGAASHAQGQEVRHAKVRASQSASASAQTVQQQQESDVEMVPVETVEGDEQASEQESDDDQ